MQHGLLLINLGTPQEPTAKAVKRYLRVFLMDKRVITLPFFLRALLVYGIVLPFRLHKTLEAYQSIWTDEGSPLLVNSQDLVHQLQQIAPENLDVALAMRYGRPSLTEALKTLQHCQSITILPLYPQYASATTGSVLEAIMQLLAKQNHIPAVSWISDFYQHPSYLSAQVACIKPYLQAVDHLLFSYHGLPEHQLEPSGCFKPCKEVCTPDKESKPSCYRAQCFQTSQLLAQGLSLKPEQYSTAFQSRLGKTPWIKPYTEVTLATLASKGIQHLAVVCPSFVCDCLETLEEINQRGKELWLSLGGKTFTYIPCLNSHPLWIDAILEMTQLDKTALIKGSRTL